MKALNGVDEYIASAPVEIRPKLKQLREAIRKAAPDAVESISYGMPFYSFKGESGFTARLCYFGLTKGSIAFYMRPHVLAKHADEVEEIKSTKSALHLPLDKPISVSLIKKLVRTGIRMHGAGRRVR